MTTTIKLGELAWRVDDGLVDARRVAVAMSSPENIHAQIFDRWAARSEGLKTYAPRLQKKIKGGFRQTSRQYLTKAAEIIKRGLIENKATKIYWDIYRGCLADEIHDTKPNLHELLSNVEVSEEDFEEVNVCEFFLKKLSEHASEYEVYRQDLEWLLECLPLQRPDNWRELVEHTPNFDDLAQLKLDVATLSKKMDKQLEINEEVANVLQKLISTQKVEELIKIESKAIGQKLTEQSLEIKRQGAKLELGDEKQGNLISENKKAAAHLGEELDERRRQYMELTAVVSELDNEVKRMSSAHQTLDEAVGRMALDSSSLRDEVSDLSIAVPADVSLNIGKEGAPYREANFISPFQEKVSFVSADERLESDNFTYPEFLSGFINRVRARQLNISEVGLRAMCGLIIGSPVIVTSDEDMIVTWLEELGCLGTTSFRDVSPLWAEPHVWGVEQKILARPHIKGKRIVVLGDYDEGLTETYLSPVLKSWARSDYVGGMGKLVLIKGGDQSTTSLNVPHANLDLLNEADLKLSNKSTLTPSRAEIASIESQRTWVADELQLDEKLSGFSEEVLQRVHTMSNNSHVARISSTHKKLLNQCYEIVLQSGFDEASAEKIILDTVLG